MPAIHSWSLKTGIDAEIHQCEHCDSDRKTREVYKDFWLCEVCEFELYDNSGYPE